MIFCVVVFILSPSPNKYINVCLYLLHVPYLWFSARPRGSPVYDARIVLVSGHFATSVSGTAVTYPVTLHVSLRCTANATNFRRVLKQSKFWFQGKIMYFGRLPLILEQILAIIVDFGANRGLSGLGARMGQGSAQGSRKTPSETRKHVNNT